MKLLRYRDCRSDVKRLDPKPVKKASILPAVSPFLAFLTLSGCAVDPTLKEELLGTWRLTESGFGCASEAGEYASYESVPGAFDDIILEIAGNEARFTRTNGACEEVFEFDADFSRDGQLYLAPNKAVTCSGCAENAAYCGQIPTENWTYTVLFSSDSNTLTLTSSSESEGFADSCGSILYDEESALYYAKTAEIQLAKD